MSREGYPTADEVAALKQQRRMEEEEEGAIERTAHKLDRAARGAFNGAPTVISYAPFRAVLHWQWKRAVARGEASTFSGVWDDLQDRRKNGTLSNGAWSGNYYMAESFLEGGVRGLLLTSYGLATGTRDASSKDDDGDSDEDLDENDPSFDPPDIEHQIVAPPADRANVLASIVAKGVTLGALQPFSNACTHAIIQDKENVGFLASWHEIGSRGESMWHGWDARVISGVSSMVVRDYLMLPLCIRGSRVFRTHEVHERRWARQALLYRIRTAVVNVYTRLAASISTSLLVYPLENVRMRFESQLVVHKQALYSTWLDCVKKVWRNEGARGFYTGIKTWSMALPVELLWPLVSWQVARSIVHLVFEDDGDDALDQIRKLPAKDKGDL